MCSTPPLCHQNDEYDKASYALGVYERGRYRIEKYLYCSDLSNDTRALQMVQILK
jgi:hypothetical protein